MMLIWHDMILFLSFFYSAARIYISVVAITRILIALVKIAQWYEVVVINRWKYFKISKMKCRKKKAFKALEFLNGKICRTNNKFKKARKEFCSAVNENSW